MGEKFNPKTILYKLFFVFLTRFVWLWLQTEQKVLIEPQIFFFQKFNTGIKNAELYVDFESFKNVFYFHHCVQKFSAYSFLG